MRMKIVTFLLTATSLVAGSAFISNFKHSTYPTILMVVDVDETVPGGVAEYVTSTGCHYWYNLDNDFDIRIGDFYACVMDDNGTSNISDDTIIQRKYTRIDLFETLETEN